MAVQLSYQVRGRRGRTALFFLHGFMGSHADWEPTSANFENEYFCLLPDLPGHGSSALTPEERSCAFESTASGLISIMEELNLEKVVLIGYSLGGRIALFTTLGYPGRIRALILEGANPGVAGPIERDQRCKDDESWARMLERGDNHSFVEQWYAQDLFSSLRRHPEKLAALKQTRLENDPRSMASAMRAFSLGKQPSLWELLDLISIPVLLVSGALDSKYRGINERMASRMCYVKQAVIEDAGHNTHLEQPEKFLEVVTSFLQSVS